LDDLASRIQRPFPLLTVLADRTAVVSTYVHQGSGLTSIFSQAQIQNHVDRQAWVPKQRVAGGTAIQPEVAMEYGLINSVEETSQLALSRLGLSELPEPMRSSWIDATITLITAQPWIARLLLMIGMMALMVELGSPGISLGGLVAGLCFLGYFWIEALNGNVEMLEILLFFGGIFVLAIELFVLPGFGIFGVTGLMMIFVSLVLAAQTFVWPTSSAELSTVSSNLFWIALIGLGGMIGLVFLHQKLEQLPMFRWLSLQPGGTESIEEVQQREVLTHYEHLAGQLGLTTTRLNPSGKAQFGDDLVSVVGCDGMIEAGSQVRVVEVRGNLIIVEEYQ
jgi:membrane-bound ClpP family serine protease